MGLVWRFPRSGRVCHLTDKRNKADHAERVMQMVFKMPMVRSMKLESCTCPFKQGINKQTSPRTHTYPSFHDFDSLDLHAIYVYASV